MTPQEREARLRAARRMQDDIYQGIGATDRPDVDGRGGRDEAEGPSRLRRGVSGIGDGLRARASQARDNARDSATSMTRAGTQPLRDLLETDSGVSGRMAQREMDADEDDSQVMMRAKASKKPKGGY